MQEFISYFDTNPLPPEEILRYWLDKPLSFRASDESSTYVKSRGPSYSELLESLVVYSEQQGKKRYGPNSIEEKLLSRNGYYSIRYAMLNKQPFPPGEKAIGLNRSYALEYATDILVPAGIYRFEEAESELAKHWLEGSRYAIEVLKRRFTPAEKAIFYWAPLAILNAYDDTVKLAGEDTTEYKSKMRNALLQKKYSIEDEDAIFGREIAKLYDKIGFSSELFNYIRAHVAT